MRRVRYSVAMSLDGFIAGPRGEYDWIVMDPAVDFAEFAKQFDTVLMGRKTFELTRTRGGTGGVPGMRNYVFSRTLAAKDHPAVVVVKDAAATVAALREEAGRDIWLMGGGALFGSLLEQGLVDTVELGVVPILLSEGIPVLPPPARRARLELVESKAFPTSGTVRLSYRVRRG